MFIRPLQKDIEEQEEDDSAVDYTEPLEEFLSCKKLFYMHQLHLHVESGECKKDNTNDSLENSGNISETDATDNKELALSLSETPPPAKQRKIKAKSSRTTLSNRSQDSVATAPLEKKSPSLHSKFIGLFDEDVVEVLSSSDESKPESEVELQSALCESYHDKRLNVSVDDLLQQHYQAYMYLEYLPQTCKKKKAM